MVEVDVFWAYGIGAGFALAAAGQVRSRELAHDTQLFPATLYCAALFAPSGAWLLWGFPSWETMHVGSAGTIPAWLVALFAVTNTTQGVLGYLLTRRLLRAGRLRTAAAQLLAAYFAMFFILVHGWDGTGYQRFFSETRADFRDWESRPPLTRVGEWAGSEVALTLYGMGLVLLPVMFWLWIAWHRAGRRALGLPSGPGPVLAFFGTMHGLVWIGGLGGAIVTSVLIHLLGPWIGLAVAGAAGGAVIRPALTGAVRRLVPQDTRTEPDVEATVDEPAATRTR